MGVLLVALTGWTRLDPIVAIIVGLNILVTGFRLVSQSVTSLLDAALPPEELALVDQALAGLASTDVDFTQIRTRASGRHRFVSAAVLVPGDWSVEQAHRSLPQPRPRSSRRCPQTDVQLQVAPRVAAPQPPPRSGSSGGHRSGA